jgi:hypothetical protein
LSLREAVALASDDEADPDHTSEARPLKPPHDWPADRRKRLFPQWWSLRARWLAVYAADGSSHAEISALFGMEPAAIDDLARRLTSPEVPRFPELHDRESLFRSEVELQARAIIAHVWESAAALARFSGFERSTVRELEAVGRHLRRAAPVEPWTLLDVGDVWSRTAWCMAGTEAQIALGITTENRPFSERWAEQSRASEAA